MIEKRFGASVGFGFYETMCRKRAKTKGLECDVDAAFLHELFNAQSGKCAVTGLSMSMNSSRHTAVDKSPYYASVDRVDSSRGYVRGNIQFVCLAINYMRNTFSMGQLTDFISKMK